MPWFERIVPESIKKNVCAYLVQRYLGQFFEEKLTRDQLDVDLYNGTGTVEKISLDVQALNELGEKHNWPMEFVDGFIDKLFITVPWSGILREPSFVEVTGLKITVQPKQRTESATSMFESIWNSMTSSMQLAEECAKQDAMNAANTAQPYEGIEIFAQTIDSILSRVKVKFLDTVIQLEHVPKESLSGVGIVINIDEIDYSDEAGSDPTSEEATNLTSQDSSKAYFVQSFTTKRFTIQGVRLSTVEFSSRARTFSKSIVTNSLFFEQKDEDSDEEQEGLRHVVEFGRISNRLEVRIRLKQSESLAGPKVAIEVNLGSVVMLLSPRSLHVLLELADGLSSPADEDTSNVAPKSRCTAKPMSSLDYQRVEQELQQQLHPAACFGLQGTQGWSSPVLDESDTDENFLPMKNAMSGMYDSTLSGISSSMDSSMSSSLNSSVTEHSHRTRRRLNQIETDPSAEISHFQVRLTSLSLLLLHDDLLIQVLDDPNQILVPSSVQQMQKVSENFFQTVGDFVLSAFGNKDFENARNIFDKACNLSHLRLLAAPIQIEADEKTTLSAFSISGSLTAAKMELTEVLFGGKVQHVPLVKFHESVTLQGVPVFPKPNLKLNFRHVEKSGKRRGFGPKTDLSIVLGKCDVEFDITIVDRIAALLNPHPVCLVKKQPNVWDFRGEASLTQVNDSKLDLRISSSSLKLKLRFPVPDFRAAHDQSRLPWWERHVRPDFLSLLLTEASFNTSFQSQAECKEFCLQTKSLEIFYHETEQGEAIALAKTSDPTQETSLTIKIFPKKEPEEVQEPEVDPMTQSMYGMFENQSHKQPGPFSAKRVVHESDTPHGKILKDDTEELVLPGDKSEMDNFVRTTCESVQIYVELNFGSLSLQLVSKHVYELIYNRINSDLLLWEASAPRFKANLSGVFESGQDRFAMCKSGVQYDSDSDSEDDLPTTIFYSAYERGINSTKVQETTRSKRQNYFVFNINIAKGVVSMFCPVRDKSTNVIPNQQGEFLLNVQDAGVFVVNGYEGDENLGFVCVQVHKAELFHCDMSTIPNTMPSIKEFGSVLSANLHPTVYQSEPGMLANARDRGGQRELLTVAVRIQANHETHHVKTVRVAIGLNKATLRHRMVNEPNSWISHILDFFNVQDYPIPGYHAKDVLTELHLHLWDCAVDYRPLYLPLRSAVVLGNFSMSSHLSAQANSSTLRFIAEECGLFLSERDPPRDGVASRGPVELKRDYVNVIELGLFELSLKINDKKSGINPHIDLRASNNIVNIHTCSDSGRALMQLINYFASDGDLLSNELEEEITYPSPRHQPQEEELIPVDESQGISNLSISQHEYVNELLGEAMKESESSEEGQEIQQQIGTKLFFFPDENQANVAEEKALKKPLPQVTCELGDTTTLQSNKSSDTDDEFCFVGTEGLVPKNGLPDIKWLSEEPVRMIDNHFAVPVGKSDLLKPPKHFPVPVMRYTLVDMSIVWHMYGGNDFKLPGSTSKKVNFDQKINQTVSFSNNKKEEVSFGLRPKKTDKLSWIEKGGVNRNHNILMELQLNKVRFQHEVYPETTAQASRQILIITDVEIRDRLESSQINVFLYQYTSQAMPKQSHAHMIVIKALHIRPDSKLKTQECCLKVSLLPLRLNIDQDALFFLMAFFSGLGEDQACQNEEKVVSSKHNTPTHQPPVMTVSSEDEQLVKEQAQIIVDENLMILLEENDCLQSQDKTITCSTSSQSDSLPVYFRKVVFSPEVKIRLDYDGKFVDMTHGSLPGLLMGLGKLQCTELRLKRISHRHGLLGVDKLMSFLLREWLNDIKMHQLPNLLSGVGPMNAIVKLFQGIIDLFWMPIEQYQKDGRIVRGLQRGANSFTTSTAIAALELTTRIIHLIQITAETAYDMLSPGPSVKRIAKSKGKRKRYYNQPQDIREGMTNAYHLVREGIGETADNIVQVASHEKEQKGYSGAVGGVLRQIPPTIFKPIIIASEATSNVLGGMKSQLVPDARREANQKWRRAEE